MNFVDVTIVVENEQLWAQAPGFKFRIVPSKAVSLKPYVGQTVTMGIRPEHLVERSRLAGATDDMCINVTVDVIELLGNEIFVYLQAGPTLLTARMAPDVHLTRGQQIQVAAEPDKLHFFDPKTEAAIR